MNATHIWTHLRHLRDASPLVVNITNYVAANTNANALLALGVSPVMSHAAGEMADLVAVARSVVINLGSLNDGYVAAMFAGGEAANRHDLPVVLDPVAAGASFLRRATATSLLTEVRFAAIRGNASEILALAGETLDAKGVDSLHESASAVDASRRLARQNACAVCISGEVDYVTDGDTVLALHGGSPLMPAVTGMGCTATAVVGACLAVGGQTHLEATAMAMGLMKVAGGMAAEGASGPGSLAVRFLDALWSMTEADLAARLRCEAL